MTLSDCKYSIYISAYADGELSEERKDFLEKHLAECPRCRQVLEEVKGISSLLQGRQELFSHPAKEILSEKILSAVKASSQKLPLLARPAFRVGALCAVVLLAFLCLFNIRSTKAPASYAKLDEIYPSPSIEYVESDVGPVLTFDSQEGKLKVIWILEDTGGMIEDGTNGNRA